MQKEFDLVVFGATGFTGRLVAEYLQGHAAGGADRQAGRAPLRWAMAGRNLSKLAELRRQIGAPDSLPLLVADASNAAALASLAARTRVVISTVGPYQRHGQPLVSACAQGGCDYVDLCGEPGWMAQMIALLEVPARASGSRIVFSCGFDSIPFDLGVLFLQDEAQRRFGAPLTGVRGRVRTMKGGLSGGTIASAMATFEQMGRDPALAGRLADPFALTPGFRGPPQPEGESASYDELAGSWTGPFVMATINTKNVHRSNALLGHPWGRDFVYDERMLAGEGVAGERRARRMVRSARLQNALLGFAPSRAMLRRFVLPKPGEGPDQRARETGRYEICFAGQTATDQVLRAVVKGDRDPGYGSTARMIAEAAICLAHDVDHQTTPGGVWTPGAAMGQRLTRRLQARAGLSFEIEASAKT